MLCDNKFIVMHVLSFCLLKMYVLLPRNQEECRESPASLVATISELLRYKVCSMLDLRDSSYF